MQFIDTFTRLNSVAINTRIRNISSDIRRDNGY